MTSNQSVIQRLLANGEFKGREKETEEIFNKLITVKKLKTNRIGSYHIKHLFERYHWYKYQQSIYYSNEEGILLMNSAGFEGVKVDRINWNFNTSYPQFEKVFPELSPKFKAGLKIENKEQKNT